MAAADKLFVDLLPDNWQGPPPGLPQDVVEELARLARDAERLEHLAHQKEKQKKLIPVPVHVASLPTFTRYVFDVPDQISVSADRAKERLTLTFDAPIPFDLSDAEVALPATIASIKAEVETDSALVRFSFVNAVDVRTFRDGKGYVVDILKGDAATAMHEKAAAAGSPPPVLEASPSVKPPAMETGKPNWAPPAIAAQMPPAAAETMAPAARVQPTAPEPAAPAARDTPTAPEAAALAARSPANSAGSGDSGSASPANSAGSGDSGSASHANTAGSGGSSGASPVNSAGGRRHGARHASSAAKTCGSSGASYANSAGECGPGDVGRAITAEDAESVRGKALAIGFGRCCRAPCRHRGPHARAGRGVSDRTREIRVAGRCAAASKQARRYRSCRGVARRC